jgi:uncharacterized protein (TIGR03067 family)
MKYTLSALALFLGLHCAGTDRSAMEPGNLDGTWVPIRQELGGKALPAVVFATQRLVIRDSVYTLTAESVDRGIVTYTEKSMDIYGKEGVNAGKHFTAIYTYEEERLTVCYNLRGDRYPESFETGSSPLLFLSVFRKESAQ